MNLKGWSYSEQFSFRKKGVQIYPQANSWVLSYPAHPDPIQFLDDAEYPKTVTQFLNIMDNSEECSKVFSSLEEAFDYAEVVIHNSNLMYKRLKKNFKASRKG